MPTRAAARAGRAASRCVRRAGGTSRSCERSSTLCDAATARTILVPATTRLPGDAVIIGEVKLHRATRGFETAGERYERGRPDYPAEAIDWMVAHLGLTTGARVLDIGAGTGKLTRPLLERGLDVIAVDPVDGMLATLRATAPRADVRAGQAEALPLADDAVDGIVAGQAFHWFASAAALDEFARVLRPPGRLALVWNRRDLDQPLQAEIGRLIAPYRGSAPAHATDAWRAAFTGAAPFRLVAERTTSHSQRLDADGLVDRVLSISFVAALDERERGSVAARVRELVRAAPLELRYVTELFVYGRRFADV
jgi:SAM-dependent methyltransferase